jgi:hypothetical protein
VMKLITNADAHDHGGAGVARALAIGDHWSTAHCYVLG